MYSKCVLCLFYFILIDSKSYIYVYIKEKALSVSYEKGKMKSYGKDHSKILKFFTCFQKVLQRIDHVCG